MRWWCWICAHNSFCICFSVCEVFLCCVRCLEIRTCDVDYDALLCELSLSF
ncbi:hypothetical protein MtrunA17_Chr3g0089411 [Medicago truncatula]|uniref:Transmembrane protein n=1 Tax=Medicago truncatula TaxID=3880 RepID=A0A396IPM6_MEDTR|nr:hypothetical protein MtrunA17_Chr3g0089411 [Medicago truncatula]